MKFHIPKNEQWAKPFLRRLRYNNFIGFTSKDELSWTCKVDFSRCPPGTSIKLIGTSEVKPFSYNRVKYNGWGDLLNVAHEDSDRIICIKRRDGKIGINAYAYRDGIGAVSPRELRQGKDYNKSITTVDDNQEFHVKLNVTPSKTEYTINTPEYNQLYQGYTEIPRESKSLLRYWTFAHAAGAHGPGAPEDIYLTIQKT